LYSTYIASSSAHVHTHILTHKLCVHMHSNPQKMVCRWMQRKF
jgi:hypothetical protein